MQNNNTQGFKDGFKDKVAVITGAASGIGLGLANHCAKQSMAVVLADVNELRLQTIAESLRALNVDVLVVVTDVSKPEAVEALAQAAYDRFGRVDLLFNNAGVLISGFSWERSVEDWQWIININLMGVIHGIKSFVPRMLAQDSPAHIVNTASLAGFLAAPLMGPYTVSKQAVVALTETLHYELASINAKVKTSVLCPGSIATGIAGSGADRKVSSAISDKANDELMDFLTTGVAEGMSPALCAEKVFAAISNEEFWIFTHPDFKPAYQRFVDSVMQDSNPSYEAYITDE